MTPPIDQLHAAARTALATGDWYAAQRLGAQMAQIDPLAPAAYFVAGVGALRSNQLGPSIALLQRAVSLAPDEADYAVELARAYVTDGQFPDAVAEADRALALAPHDGRLLDTLGVIYGRVNQHERAIDAFRAAVDARPLDANHRFNLATALAFVGRIDEAESELESSLGLDLRIWRAHLFLSQLRCQTSESNHLERLRALLLSSDQPEARLYLNMAISKELEDIGRDAEAFSCLVAGKTAGGAGRGYTPGRDEATVGALIEGFSRAPVEGGFPSAEPIFIIGMPRTGTTLVDRILSSHPDVRSAGELRNFLVALNNATGRLPGFVSHPQFPQHAEAIDWTNLGRAYLASTRPDTGQSPRFIDKLPHNFLYAGYIAKALPNARIICLRRNAIDTCLSNFRQVFALDSPYFDYSFDLLDTGRYYLLFDRLMAFWQQAVPGRILEVQYEELVDNQAAVTRRLLDFCGLPWHEGCLRFEDNTAAVATASAIQVREPMNRRSVGRWRRYEKQLAELVQLLALGGVVTPD